MILEIKEFKNTYIEFYFKNDLDRDSEPTLTVEVNDGR